MVFGVRFPKKIYFSCILDPFSALQGHNSLLGIILLKARTVVSLCLKFSGSISFQHKNDATYCDVYYFFFFCVISYTLLRKFSFFFFRIYFLMEMRQFFPFSTDNELCHESINKTHKFIGRHFFTFTW